MTFLNTDWREANLSDLVWKYDVMEPNTYMLLPNVPVFYAINNQYSCWYRVHSLHYICNAFFDTYILLKLVSNIVAHTLFCLAYTYL